jgi:hypothetical protein
VNDSGYISRKTPRQYEPPADYAKCARRNCKKCLELEECLPHIETPAGLPFTWEGNEAALIEMQEGKKK